MFGGGEEEGTLPNTKTHPYGYAVIFSSIFVVVDIGQGGVGGDVEMWDWDWLGLGS